MANSPLSHDDDNNVGVTNWPYKVSIKSLYIIQTTKKKLYFNNLIPFILYCVSFSFP